MPQGIDQAEADDWIADNISYLNDGISSIYRKK